MAIAAACQNCRLCANSRGPSTRHELKDCVGVVIEATHKTRIHQHVDGTCALTRSQQVVYAAKEATIVRT
jgi:hypothetical protein